MKKLTPKEEAFCHEYIVDKNGTQAAKRAGYKGSDKVLGITATRLLAKSSVKARLEELLKAQVTRTDITADRILKALLNIAEFDLAEMYDREGNLKPVDQWPEGAGKVIAGLDIFEEFTGTGNQRTKIGETKKLKLEPRTPALIALGKHLKLFIDRVELSGNTDLADRISKARKRIGR